MSGLLRLPRDPETPPLDARLVQLLTELCFRNEENLLPADLLFVFGSTHDLDRMAERIHDVLGRGLASAVMLTGGRSSWVDEAKPGNPESVNLLEHVDVARFPDVAFHYETTSTNTRENVEHALRAHDFSSSTSIIFFCKSVHAGRAAATLRAFLPGARLQQTTISLHYAGQPHPLTRDLWHTNDHGRSRVWGEFLRIKAYGEKGDIATHEVKDLLRKIDATVAAAA